MNQPLPAVDLSTAFGKARANDLGAPPPRKPRKHSDAAQRPVTAVPAQEPDQAPEEPQEAAEAPSDGESSTAKAEEPTATTRHAPAPRASRRVAAKKATTTRRTETEPQTRPVLVLWTPESIRSRMQAHQAQTRMSYLKQVFKAVEETYDQLPDYLAGEIKVVRGRFFEYEEATQPEEDQSSNRKQISIRNVLQSNLDALDRIAAEIGEDLGIKVSRSKLVNAALDLWLPQA